MAKTEYKIILRTKR